MKEMRITFEDEEFTEIEKAKDFLEASWHDFVLVAARKINAETKRSLIHG